MSQTLVIFSPESYSVSMTYDNMGGIVQKNQTASLNYPGYPGEKYNYYYTQGNTAHPHATSKVWDRRNHKQYTYGFDSNGNPTTTHEQYAPPLQGQPNPSGPIDLIQQNYWDEQNQLRGLWNLSGLHHYIYDADGQRLMKSSVPMSYSSVNAQQLQATNSITAQDYTVYVSAGLVYESNGGSTTYTKHYYAGPLRVASQIGSANPNYETHPLGGQIAPGGPANTTPESYGVAALSDLNTLLANYGMAVNANEPPQDILSMQVINDPDECRMFYGDDLIEENRCLCDNFPDIAIQQGIDCNPYTPIYWYHPDYIGNIEFVTDRTGQPYQHFYYAAFGDPMVSQHVGTGSFNSAYRFNAKEFDEETGNYYYGARYYQPKSSIWMGVDALATSYPGMNPYNFVKGNPIMAIDPDGDTVTVNGDQSRMFVNELNKRLGDELKIRRDKENGTLSYEFKGDENNISQEAQSVMDAIDDDKIMVNIEASKSGIMSDGKVVPGGSFLGTTLSPDKKCVETSQKVVPFLLKALDKAGGAQRGQSQLHELLESYEAGKLSLQQGINAKPGGAIYNQAHGTVPPQGFDPSSIGAFVDPKTGWVHFYFNGDIYVQTLRN